MTGNTQLLLALQRMRFLKTAEKLRVLEYCSSMENLPVKEDLVQITGRKFSADYHRETLKVLIENDMSVMLKQGIRLLFMKDDEYPSLLREIYNPPFVLYYKGEIPPSDSLSISVVGTRKATGRGLNRAFSLSFDLARSGAAVISGLAEGIDSAAHRGALAGNGYTAAVFGCGLDRVFPSFNNKLASSILDKGGTLLSEYPPGTIPSKYNFPERNRIVSALSEAIVLVESPSKSGSLITADFALEQGRDVFVLQSASITGTSGAGCRRLLEEGALPISSAQDILKYLSYRTTDLKGKFRISQNSESSETGRFLAERMLAELSGKEISREGVYYSL